MTAGPAQRNPSDSGEFGCIQRILKPLAAGYPGARGLADDAATVDVPAGHQLVVTTDGMVAGVHFLPDDPPADIAAKLLAVNLSDLAAKGAEPLAYSLVTSLPVELPASWLDTFARGLAEGQRRWGIHLLGGDSVSTPGPVSITVSALGLVPTGAMVGRSGARSGDAVMVSGTIGDAALGLLIAQGDDLGLSQDASAFLLSRLRRPEPRLPLRPVLRAYGSAAVDISDGLVADLGHLADASGVSLAIATAAVPISDATRSVLDRRPDLLDTILTGGDDYEVAFTVPSAFRSAVESAAQACGVPVACIGAAGPGPAAVTVVGPDGAPRRLGRTGWSHF